jgi:hypothetical protein
VRGWAAPDSDRWKVVLTTEDKGFVAMSEHESDKTLAPAIDVDGRATFQRPGAVVFRRL